MAVTQTYNVGDRVYYLESGPEDTGTVKEVIPVYQKGRGKAYTDRVLRYSYLVTWDNDDHDDIFSRGELVPVTPERDMDEIKSFEAQAHVNLGYFAPACSGFSV